jgi:hypothetical protein
MAVSRTRGRIDREDDAPPPRSDAYTGLLAISLGAMVIGCLLLYLDWSQYPQKAPPAQAPPIKYQAGEAAPPAPPAGAPAGPAAGQPMQ